MSADAPKVRDFTAQDRTLPVEVEAQPVYELLLSLFVWGGKSEAMEYDCGSEFFEHFEEHATAEALTELTEMIGCGALWLPLFGIARDANKTSSIIDFIEHVRAMDPVALRLALIDGACVRGGLSDADATAAAMGDAKAVATAIALPDVEEGFKSLLEVDGDVTRHRVASMLEAANDILGPSIAAVMPALRRDADEKGSLARSMKPQRLVENATNGVTFEMQADMTGVLLVPSKIIRPWTVMTEHNGLKVFAYSVADEHLHADPDAPPGYLVELYKALGDERRLKMLSFLADGDRGLMEIADHVDLAKSTTHHHLRILRSAGLVRVTIGGSKTYSLRTDRVPEAGRLLDAYLTTPAGAAESATTPEPQRS